MEKFNKNQPKSQEYHKFFTRKYVAKFRIVFHEVYIYHEISELLLQKAINVWVPLM